MRSWFAVDVGEQVGEEVGPLGLVVGGGVVALPQDDGLERVVGGEVDAGLADRLEGAVELGGSLTPAVAEESVMDLVANATHVWADGVAVELVAAVVEGFDFGGDGRVIRLRRPGWRSGRSGGSCPRIGARAAPR